MSLTSKQLTTAISHQIFFASKTSQYDEVLATYRLIWAYFGAIFEAGPAWPVWWQKSVSLCQTETYICRELMLLKNNNCAKFQLKTLQGTKVMAG